MNENQNKAGKGSAAQVELEVKETMKNSQFTESVNIQLNMSGTGREAGIVGSDKLKWYDAIECQSTEFLPDSRLLVENSIPFVSTFFGQFNLQGKSKEKRNTKQSIFEFKRTGL